MRPLPIPSRDPFSLGHSGPSVLMLHGFAGSPYELRPLGEVLNEAGYRVQCPVLAGHHGDAAELAATSAEEILQSAQLAAQRLDRIDVLCGFSMGALLATILAAERGDLDALVLLAPAVKLGRLGRLAARMVRVGLWPGPATLPNWLPPDCGDSDGRLRHQGFNALPVAALGAFEQLRKRCLQALPAVTTPTLVLHGGRDRLVPARSSRLISKMIGAAVVERHVLGRSHHMLALDAERELLFSKVLRFVRHHAPSHIAGQVVPAVASQR